MSEVGYYNYYNNPHRYSSDKVINTYSKELKRTQSDSYKSTLSKSDPYSDENLSIKELDEKLAPMAQELREKFSDASDVDKYLCEKYFGTSKIGYTKRWEEPEKYAMYENDKNAVLFGTVGRSTVNRHDPRLNCLSQNWEEYEAQDEDYKRTSLNKNMENLLKNNNIELNEEDSLLINVNPYSLKVKVYGCPDDATCAKLTKLLESNGNSKNILNFGINNQEVNEDSVAKMRAYHTLKEYTGIDISSLVFEDGEYYTASGEDIYDVLKKKIENSNVPEDFHTATINHTMELLEKVSHEGWNNIEDLNIKIGYSAKEGFYVLGNIWEA